PELRVLTQKLDEQVELGTRYWLGDVGSAHGIEDDDRWYRCQEIPPFGGVCGFQIDNDVPAESGDSPEDRQIVGIGCGVHKPPDEVEPNSAHAGTVQPL